MFERLMVFGDLYILGMHLSPDLFLTLPTSELTPPVLAYIGPNAHSGTSAHSLARRGYPVGPQPLVPRGGYCKSEFYTASRPSIF